MIRAFGIDRFRRHQISQLSTGTRRVVDLASIVLARPRLLLLDEPPPGSPNARPRPSSLCCAACTKLADTTIVLVEHDVPLVFALCSKVVMMETGRWCRRAGPTRSGRDPRALAAYLGASEEALGRLRRGADADVRSGPPTRRPPRPDESRRPGGEPTRGQRRGMAGP